MKQVPIQSNPFPWKELVVVGVPGAVIVVGVVGGVIVARFGLRGSDSGDRAEIIKAAARFIPAGIIKAAVGFIR